MKRMTPYLLSAVLVLGAASPAQAHRKHRRYKPHHGIHTYADLDHCESTHGAGSRNHFQFKLSTWHKAGGTGRPEDASYDEQLQRADAWQKQTGWYQWPACSKAMGLR